MSRAGNTILAFLTGLGIGAAIAVLFAPRSGEETRERIADATKRNFKTMSRRGRRSVKQLQEVVAKAEERAMEVLRTGKEAVETVAATLK